MESDLDFSDWKEDQLLPLLQSIDSDGQFAASIRQALYPNPGLQINGLDVIPLPLTSNDAEEIKRFCRQAPFGRGDETVVDTTVRKTWELDHSQFQLTNPAWSPFFLTLVANVTREIGLNGVVAQPHKLLLYEEGSFFKRHRDSEKERGMLGTLIVCLPAKHVGGSLEVSFGGQKKTFATAPGSAFDITALAWYSDVAHEVQNLVQGHRLVLTYKLFQASGGEAEKSATAFIQQERDLHACLGQWQSHFAHKGMLIYPLDHKYTQMSVSLRNMKGHDRAVGQALHKVCSTHGILFFLAHMTRCEGDDDYDDPYETADEGTTLDTIFTHDGQFVGEHWTVEEDDSLVPSDYFEDRVADSEDEGEYTGNESMPSSFRYHDTVAVLISKDVLLQRLGNLHVDYRGLLAPVIRDLEKRANDQVRHDKGFELLRHALKAKKKLEERVYVIPLVVHWAMALHDKQLFQDAVRSAVVDKATQTAVVNKIASQFDELSPDDSQTVDWHEWFDDAQLKPSVWYSVMYGLENAIKSSSLRHSFMVWMGDAMIRKLDEWPTFDQRDEAFFSRVFLMRQSDEDWLSNSFLPLIATKCERGLLYRFLLMVAERYKTGQCSLATSIFQQIITLTGSKFVPELRVPQMPRELFTEAPESQLFVGVIDAIFTVGLSSTVGELFLALYTSLEKKKKLQRKTCNLFGLDVVAKFIKPLAEVLKKHNFEPTPEIQDMLELLLRDVSQSLPPQPVKPKGWIYAERWCPAGKQCADCRQLNAFLVNQTEKKFSFPAGKDRRRHLEDMLPSEFFNTHTLKDGSPHTLLVTKKRQGAEFPAKDQAYEAAVKNLKERLAVLKCDAFQRLVDDDVYANLVLFEGRTASTPAQIAGRKRAGESLAKTEAGTRTKTEVDG